MRYDCAIIGAGPAGLTIAVILARKGYKVTIFEIKDKMKQIMGDKVGIFRDGSHLQEAVNELEKL